VAPIDIPVLLSGETGVGKDLIASLIHKRSERSKKGVFMKIDCGAIPENLLESELFGYEKGAFTGASLTGKKGLFELAGDGTLYLDEIDTLSLNLQAKLLNALQDYQIMRVGGMKRIDINARIIAASNRDLFQMAQDNTFRKDLFFRLNVVTINIPPLRERRDDILPLAEYFLGKYNQKHKANKKLSPAVIECFLEYEWSGNVRELEHLIEHLIVITQSDVILFEELPKHIRASVNNDYHQSIQAHTRSLKKAVSDFESELIRKTIREYGSVRKAAKILNVNPSTITRKLKRNSLTIL
jgi:transcriptional regulator with PAS, ATPase and Fis domain